MLGLSFYQWFDEETKNLGSGTKRYSGWQTGLKTNNGASKPVLYVMPAPFVIDQKKGSKSGMLWGQVRPDATGQIIVEGRPRGATEFREVARSPGTSDGVWTRRSR